MSKAINNLLNGSKGLLEKYGYVEEERPVVKKRVNEGLNEEAHDLNYFKDCAFAALRDMYSSKLSSIVSGNYGPGVGDDTIIHGLLDPIDEGNFLAQQGAEFMFLAEPYDTQKGLGIRKEYLSLVGEDNQNYDDWGKPLRPFFKGKKFLDFVDASEADKIAVVKAILISILKRNAQGVNNVHYWNRTWPVSLDDANKIGEAFELTPAQVEDILNSKEFIVTKNSIEAEKRKRDAAAAKRAKKPTTVRHTKIIRLFKGDPKYFDEAEDIIINWYENEDNREGIKNPDLDDILDMLDACTYEDERQTVAKAIGDAASFALDDEDDDEEDFDESLNESDDNTILDEAIAPEPFAKHDEAACAERVDNILKPEIQALIDDSALVGSYILYNGNQVGVIKDINIDYESIKKDFVSYSASWAQNSFVTIKGVNYSFNDLLKGLRNQSQAFAWPSENQITNCMAWVDQKHAGDEAFLAISDNVNIFKNLVTKINQKIDMHKRAYTYDRLKDFALTLAVNEARKQGSSKKEPTPVYNYIAFGRNREDITSQTNTKITQQYGFSPMQIFDDKALRDLFRDAYEEEIARIDHDINDPFRLVKGAVKASYKKGSIDELIAWINKHLEKVYLEIPEYMEGNSKAAQIANSCRDKAFEEIEKLEKAGKAAINYQPIEVPRRMFNYWVVKLDKDANEDKPAEVDTWIVTKHGKVDKDMAPELMDKEAYNPTTRTITGNHIVKDLIDEFGLKLGCGQD